MSTRKYQESCDSIFMSMPVMCSLYVCVDLHRTKLS